MHVGPRHVTIGAEQRDATLLRAVAELLDTAGRLLGRNDLAACARAHAPLATTRPVVRRVALGGAERSRWWPLMADASRPPSVPLPAATSPQARRPAARAAGRACPQLKRARATQHATVGTGGASSKRASAAAGGGR
jgi:hypothetical protein